MQYYLNGARISEHSAWAKLLSMGANAGHDIEEIAALWAGRDDEENRDILCSIADYQIEFIA